MRYLADLVPALVRGGVTVKAVVLGPAQRAPAAFWPVSRFDAPLWRRVWSVYRGAVRGAPDAEVVDVHFALYGLLPLLSRALRHKPVMVHFQGPWATESTVAGQAHGPVAVKRYLERAVYRRAATAVVLSGAFGEILARDYGVDPARIHVIPPGVDLERFCPADRQVLRAGLGVEPGAFLVVCVRRLEYRMGIDVLLRAWRLVQEEAPGARLIIAGTGSERARLDSLVESLAYPAGVQLLGAVDDDRLVELYQAADCSVVPSRSLEGFGLVTLESLACGTPAVVTDVGGLADGVSGLDPSLVVASEDPTSLAARLIEAGRGALPTRQACRAHAETFSWDGVAQRHLELLGSLTRAAQPRRLRIVFLDHCAQLSGGELALARLIPALDVDAHVVLAEDGPLRPLLEEAGATVHLLVLGEGVRDLRRQRVGLGSVTQAGRVLPYSLRLARLIRKLQPDLVHTNSLKSALYGGLAGRLARAPVVWHVRDRIAPDYLPAPAVKLVRAAARVLPGAVIANSGATLATLGRLSAPAVAIPSPVPVPAEHNERPEGPFRVGMVGRLAPWKGQDLFLRAFARAFASGGAHAVVIGAALFGEDAYAAGLHSLVEDLGITERVEFRGFRQDVGAELARLDVVVHASTVPEPFGMVVVEAMAAGAAVVVPDRGGPAEVVEEGVTGLTYRMGDGAALAAALSRMAAEPVLRKQLGDNGAVAVARYRPEVVGAEVMAFYETVLGR